MRLSTIPFVVLVIVTSAAAQTVSLHIETSSGQSQFRIGQAIGLKATFELTPASDAPPANQPGWMITLLGHDRSVLGLGRDRFVVTPETGTRDPWNYGSGANYDREFG